MFNKVIVQTVDNSSILCNVEKYKFIDNEQYEFWERDA